MDRISASMGRRISRALGILGRNSVVSIRHIDDRNVDVGFGFFGNGDERKNAPASQQEQKRRSKDGAVILVESASHQSL